MSELAFNVELLLVPLRIRSYFGSIFVEASPEIVGRITRQSQLRQLASLGRLQPSRWLLLGLGLLIAHQLMREVLLLILLKFLV